MFSTPVCPHWPGSSRQTGKGIAAKPSRPRCSPAHRAEGGKSTLPLAGAGFRFGTRGSELGVSTPTNNERLEAKGSPQSDSSALPRSWQDTCSGMLRGPPAPSCPPRARSRPRSGSGAAPGPAPLLWPPSTCALPRGRRSPARRGFHRPPAGAGARGGAARPGSAPPGPAWPGPAATGGDGGGAEPRAPRCVPTAAAAPSTGASPRTPGGGAEPSGLPGDSRAPSRLRCSG